MPAATIQSEQTAAPAPHPQVPEPADARPWWGLVLGAGLLGVGTTITQTVERIAYLKNPQALSICDINSTLSCTSVFSHWQSSALGIPNSLIGLTVFAVLGSAGLAGVLGARLPRAYVATLLGLTVFMAGFITWYMEQSAFAIHVLCLFCVGCAVSVVTAGVGITRVAAAQHALGDGRAGYWLRLLVQSRADLVAWFGLALVIAAMLLFGLVLR